MGMEAASGWILTALEKGRSIPPPSQPDDIKPEAGGFINMLALDIDAYAEKHSVKTVQKTLNLELPAWLITFAESQHIDFSELLRESLKEKHHQLYR